MTRRNEPLADERDVLATIYPSKERLAKTFARFLAMILAIAGGCVIALHIAWPLVPFRWYNLYETLLALGFLVYFVCGLGTLYMLHAASLIYRLVSWSPSILLTREGLVDNCSLLVGGVGLIRWERMRDVFVTTFGASRNIFFAKPNYVLVRLEDPQGIRPNRNILRIFQWVFPLAARVRGDVLLPAYMVSTTPGELFDAIRHAYLAERERRPTLQHRRIAGLI